MRGVVDAIYLVISGQSQGPFTQAQVQQKLAAGEITPQTPAWYQGLADWTTVGALIGSAPASSPPTAPPFRAATSATAAAGYTQPELKHLASCQSQLLWMVLAGIIFNVATRFVDTKNGLVDVAILVLVLPLLVYTLICFYRLAAALRMSVPWVFCILAVIPCVSLITAVVLVVKSSKILKEAGVRVGLMGANRSDLG